MSKAQLKKALQAISNLEPDELRQAQAAISARLGQDMPPNVARRLVELEQENTELKLWQTFNTQGAQAGAQAAIRQAAQEIADLRALLAYYQRTVPAWFLDGMSPPDYDEQTTYISGLMWLQRGEVERQIRFARYEYPGDLDPAIENALHSLILLAGVPLPGEISGQIPGLTDSDLIDICRQLAPFQDEAEYRARRAELFGLYWPRIEACWPRIEANAYGAGDRSKAQDQFNKVVDRTLAKQKKRIGEVILEALPENGQK